MGMCIPFAGLTSSGPLGWIAFDLMFQEEVVEREQAHPTENFPLGFDVYNSLQLSTDDKQPKSRNSRLFVFLH